MANESNVATELQGWWQETVFPGKEFCTLSDDGELKLMANGRERTLATLTVDSADITVRALSEKYPDVVKKVDELEQEWQEVDDKIKLSGKLARNKEYLHSASALGDFESLLERINKMETVIASIAEENFKKRLSIVEKIEELSKEENIKQSSQAIKDLTEEWKTVGFTDKKRGEELWTRMETAKNSFFDYKRQKQETEEKDMLQNLDLKLELVEKAEHLASSEAYRETSDVYRAMMDEWKKIGKIPHEKNEELWNRFINAKNIFFDRKRQHFEYIQGEQEQNYEKKLQIVAEAETIKDSQNWNETKQRYTELMEQWKSIGKVPAEKSEELWDRFSKAKDYFFQSKRNFSETRKVTFDDNYAQKLAILKRAELIKTSTQWRETTDEMNDLMTEWKRIGPVPKEHSDRIWREFLDARGYFFEKKDQNRERRKQYQEKQKESRLEQTKKFLFTLKNELKEEEDKLKDFKESMSNITTGPKEKELQGHLQHLIQQTEHKVKHKNIKIEEVEKQLSDLEGN